MFRFLRFALLAGAITLAGCGGSDDGPPPPVGGDHKFEVTSNVLNTSYGGNGFQWGGYDFLEEFTGSAAFGAEMLKTITDRVSYMRPGVVRIMVNEEWNYPGGNYTISENTLIPILQYCQSNDVTVCFGEWGHKGGDGVDTGWLGRAVSFLDYLVNDRGFSCIKHYVMVNEPNGDWSSTNNNGTLWQTLVAEHLYPMMQEKGLLTKVSIMGPDVAYWNASSALQALPWMNISTDQMKGIVTSYDVHAYPGSKYVRSGDFSASLADFMKPIPAGGELYMNELGGKYPDEPLLDAENKERIAKKPNTADDSNMFVYDGFYGIDMASAMIQCMQYGYAGVVVWDLDDAMYCEYNTNGSYKGLKRWGFWNSLGTDMNDTADTQLRPWYYTMSLMCRYFPKGSTIYEVSSPDNRLHAVAGMKDGKYTVAILNTSYVKFQNVQVALPGGASAWNGGKLFTYSARSGTDHIAERDSNGYPAGSTITYDPDVAGHVISEIPELTFILLTGMN